MAEVTPKLVYEGSHQSIEPFGSVAGHDGQECPIFIRLAASGDGVVYVDLADEFREKLHEKPEAVASCADELSAMLRDAVLREGVAGEVS